jgi:hypothetical protein
VSEMLSPMMHFAINTKGENNNKDALKLSFP